MAVNSTWPPPMVPTTSRSNTPIQAPASRGTEPCVACTVTSTAGSPASRAVNEVVSLGAFTASMRNNPGARVTPVGEMDELALNHGRRACARGWGGKS